MRKGWMLLVVAAAALLSAAVVVPGGPQPDDLKKQVAQLRKQVKAQTAVLAAHDKMLRKVVSRTHAANLWLTSLPATVDGLKVALGDTRDKGFTSAGPNPAARTALLKALEDFGARLKVGLVKDEDE